MGSKCASDGTLALAQPASSSRPAASVDRAGCGSPRRPAPFGRHADPAAARRWLSNGRGRSERHAPIAGHFLSRGTDRRAQLAGRAGAAIDELDAELTQVKSRHQADAISAAIRRDRHIVNLGGAHAARVEQGLDVARGIADQQAATDKSDIANRLFITPLKELVQQGQSTGAAISRSGRRSANALVRTLNGLGNQLTSFVPERPPR